MEKIHNKAIRDKIPEIIGKSGKNFLTRTLPDKAFLKKMEEKLVEEVEEYRADGSVWELADILEVVYRIGELKGCGRKKLEKMRVEKAGKNGAFRKNLLLVNVFGPKAEA